MKNQKDSIEELKLFVLKMMSDDQDSHSKNLEALKQALGIELSKDTTKLLNEIFKVKMELLNKILDKIQKL